MSESAQGSWLLSGVLAVALLLGGVFGFQKLKTEEAERKAVQQKLDNVTTERNRLANQLETMQGDLSQLRQRGNAIYRLNLIVTLSPVSLADPSLANDGTGATQLNLGLVATLGGAEQQARFTNPDLLAPLQGNEIRFSFEPEKPSQFLSQQIDLLAHYSRLDLDYAAVFRAAHLEVQDPASASVELRVNDLPVFSKGPVALSGDLVEAGALHFDLSDELGSVSRRYTAALRGAAIP